VAFRGNALGGIDLGDVRFGGRMQFRDRPSSFPVGPVAEADIQRVAAAMLKFGVLSPRDAAGVRQGTLVRSMISPG
jgi:hypothetical protein